MTLDLTLTYTSVPLDYNVSRCMVQATYQAADGTPMAGTITFTPAPKVITDVDANVIFYPTPINVALDETGSFSVELIATDDPDLNPWNWTWQVSESLTWNENIYTNSYSIEAPSNNIIDLADVMPVPDYTGTPIVRGRQGATGASGTGSFGVTAEANGVPIDGVTNATTAFQALVDSMSSTGGGTIWLLSKTYVVGGLILKSNVTIRSAVRSTFKPPTAYTGWILDTPVTPKQSNIHLIDINIAGGISGAGSPNTGGILFRLTAACTVQRVGISATSLGCFKQLAGQATTLINCGFQNFYNYRTLTSNEGALWLGGTDHVVIGCECNAGDFSTVYDGTNLYRCGMLLTGGVIWVYASNGEYADVGIKVTGIGNRLIGARGDVNAGPGIVIEGSENHLTNTLVLANSLGDDGNYSHIVLGQLAYGTVLHGVMEGLNFTGSIQAKHLIDDQVDIFTSAKDSAQLPIIKEVLDAQAYKWRKVNQLYTYRAIEESTIGNIGGARPQSRYVAGGTFYDTVNNKPTFSDGSKWRDSSGVIVGNLLDPRTALFNDPTEIGWVVLSGSGSTTSVTNINGWNEFHRSRALEILAGGAATSCGAQMKVATRPANVVAGTSYTVMAYHLGVTTLASLAVVVIWYDVGGTQLSTTVLAGSAQTTLNTAQLYRATGVVAPTNATQANMQFIFTRAGMANTEKFHIAKVCMVPGAPTDYVDP